MAKNVEEAIAFVYSQVDYVQKERKSGLNYSFAGEAAILNVLRPAMVEAGLTVRVHELLDVVREQVTNKNGNTSMYTTCRAVVRLAHAPSGTHVDVQALGEGADVGDKSANKAMTGALKYALRQTFALETGDDPDATASTEYERGTPTKERVSAPKKTAHSEPEQTPPVAKQDKPEWADVLVGILNDEGMKSADLAGALGVQRVTFKAIQQYIDGTGAHPRIALEGLVLSAKGQITADGDK